MRVWSSRLLSDKLCRVLDARAATVDEIAMLSGSSLRTIEQIAAGSRVQLELEERERISRSLGPYLRANPELYREPAPKTGVIEESWHRDDERAFTLKGDKGDWMLKVVFPADQCSESDIEWLWRVLKVRKGRNLKAI